MERVLSEPRVRTKVDCDLHVSIIVLIAYTRLCYLHIVMIVFVIVIYMHAFVNVVQVTLLKNAKKGPTFGRRCQVSLLKIHML